MALTIIPIIALALVIIFQMIEIAGLKSIVKQRIFAELDNEFLEFVKAHTLKFNAEPSKEQLSQLCKIFVDSKIAKLKLDYDKR